MTPAERVLRLLGNASAKQADMAFVLGLSIRQVQSALQQLRLEGHPVFTSEDGVRLAQTADEARACSDALRRRLVSQYRTYKALRNTARRMRDEENRRESLTLWREALSDPPTKRALDEGLADLAAGRVRRWGAA